jgi:7-cyano-7-deazaguanine synthase in queuosine biosynthesis
MLFYCLFLVIDVLVMFEAKLDYLLERVENCEFTIVSQGKTASFETIPGRNLIFFHIAVSLNQ